ncbi:MAG: response regulator [Planctomycetes bacterium]|nr:response regulator [Planctomycetota bacterium]
MRILIVEDDFAGRRLLQKILSVHGECDIAVDGIEAVDAFKTALQENRPYDLICLDIMMLHMNGHEALTAIRAAEKALGIGGHEGVKVIMTTALKESAHVMEAFREGCEAYLVKPIDKRRLLEEIEKLGFALSKVE